MKQLMQWTKGGVIIALSVVLAGLLVGCETTESSDRSTGHDNSPGSFGGCH